MSLMPEPVADVLSHLEPNDQLSLLIGRACRTDVWLEQHLVFLYRHLAAPSLAIFTPPQGFDALVVACDAMLRRAALPGEWEAAATGAVSAARLAHRERNRLVHDQWLAEVEDGDFKGWNRIKAVKHSLGGTATPQTLSDVKEVVAELHHASIRINQLLFALSGLLPVYRGSGATVPTDDDRRFVEGDFEIMSDGGARLRNSTAHTEG